ncbi:hypothetical protein NYP20_11460 [Pseudomonas sp. N3-W]|jgi:hypothetical protein|uniref:DUF2790 domain-containing protein n=1 Tax=Pseudomonas fungipugnans TaxID=3024217 RepID=A0ABT6QWI6_9PSED|nr:MULTISPECIES: hypothetical protein [unclassified Pseudomonas]MDI2595254.1 hypothetical protein [Pseudomonas sp. 681]UWF51539.1 hypothetical protein NYP20_11460 [Pseudomonas sp. N3-W]
MKLNMLVAVSAFALIGDYAWQSHAVRLGPYEAQASANTLLAQDHHTRARQLALDNANRKCASLGKQIGVFDVQSHWPFPTNEVANVTFVCK